MLFQHIFPLNDRGPLDYQDNSVCKELWKDFWLFVKKKKNEDQEEDLRLETAKMISDKKRYEGTIEWFGAYGAVVLFQKNVSSPDGVVLSLIGLDGWSMNVHASTQERSAIALADVRKPAVFSFPSFPHEKLEEVWKEFEKKRRKSESNNSGAARGQYQGHQGNQKTPSFLSHILGESISDVLSGTAIAMTSTQGGTTDVGLHTGCVKRNTCFPLVLSVLYFMLVDKQRLPQSGEIFEKAISLYLLTFLDRIKEPDRELYDARYCDQMLTISQEARSFLGHVKSETFKTKVLDNIMEPHFRALEKLKLNRSCPLVPQSFEDTMKSLRSPKFPSMDPLVDQVSHLTKLAQAREDAKTNLEPADSVSLVFTGKEQDCFVQMQLHNEHFWDIAVNKSFVSPDIPTERKRLENVSRVVAVIMKAAKDNAFLMKAVYRSYEALAYWIVCCAGHKAAEGNFSMLNKYGTALLASDTSFLCWKMIWQRKLRLALWNF